MTNISKSQIIKLASEGKSLAEASEILKVGKQTLQRLIKDNKLNVEFKARRAKYTLVDDVEDTNVDVQAVSGVNPIIYQEPSNVTNTSVPVNEVEEVNS